jgi:serine/threonine-protein phosphatase 2B regulatory subunit
VGLCPNPPTRAPSLHPVNQAEIEALYKRFRALDRGHKGYISPEEFLSIPELSINPVAQRLVRCCECPNFTTFVKMVAPFSPRASRDDKLAFMFTVYDVDGDGERFAGQCSPS